MNLLYYQQSNMSFRKSNLTVTRLGLGHSKNSSHLLALAIVLISFRFVSVGFVSFRYISFCFISFLFSFAFNRYHKWRKESIKFSLARLHVFSLIRKKHSSVHRSKIHVTMNIARSYWSSDKEYSWFYWTFQIAFLENAKCSE